MNFITIQAIGFVGLTLLIISFQKDKRRFTLLLQMFSAVFFLIHYSLLNAWTGAAMNVVSAARAYVFSQRDVKSWASNSMIMYGFIIAFWIASLLTWQGYISLLPAIAMSFECLALWNRNTKFIRRLYLTARPFWLSYDILVGSFAGIATEIFLVTSIVVAIFRFDLFRSAKTAAVTADKRSNNK